MRPRARTLVAASLAFMTIWVGVGLAISGGVGVSGTVTLDEPGGPTVDVVTNGGELLLDGPDTDGTVVVEHDNGNATFSSSGETGATVDTTELTGTYSRVTSVSAGSTALTVDPGDKASVTVDGGVNSVEWRDGIVDDGSRDFSYSAGSSGSITVATDTPDETLIAVASDGTVLDQSTADGSGTVTFDVPSGTYDVEINEGTAPVVDDDSASPQGGQTVTNAPVELSINVSDADFATSQGDSVDVTFYDASDDSELGTQTLTSNGTATATFDNPVGGENNWYAIATDDYGNSVQSQTFTFNAPATLTLRNESSPDEIVTTDASAEVTFFAGEEVITRETTDGTVDLTGLPADETFTVQVRADGFVTRQAIIDGIIEQQSIYLLPDSVDSVSTRFVLDDPTGQFPPQDTRVSVKKPLTVDNSTTYRTVVADTLGTGGYSTTLERDQRYLLEVTNTETGQVRTLGPYVSTTSETVTLSISALEFDNVDADLGYSWGASYVNQTDPAVRFTWGSEENTQVSDLSVKITERGGNETVILNEVYTEPGSFSETAVIPDSVEDANASTFVVEWEATIDGDTVSGSSVVGPSQLPITMPGMSEDVMSMISVFIILMVGGLFSAANVTVGGIVTSLVAGALWFAGTLPDAVSGMLIATALFISVIAHARTNQQIRPQA